MISMIDGLLFKFQPLSIVQIIYFLNHSNHLLIHQTIKLINTVIPKQETVHAIQLLNASEVLCTFSKSQHIFFFLKRNKVSYRNFVLHSF